MPSPTEARSGLDRGSKIQLRSSRRRRRAGAGARRGDGVAGPRAIVSALERRSGWYDPALLKTFHKTLRERADGLRRRFEARQAGTERPALTLGDGTVALTDNYLKVRIPPGLPRNVRVRVRVVGHTPLGGEVVT